jgi:Tfp pilus assembly protein PilF
MAGMTENLEAMLAAGNDSASLRYALATRYQKDGNIDKALVHARVAVTLDADYSAAWRIVGELSAAAGLVEDARQAYQRGIEVADRRGDQQAAKMMRVFLKRLEHQ